LQQKLERNLGSGQVIWLQMAPGEVVDVQTVPGQRAGIQPHESDVQMEPGALPGPDSNARSIAASAAPRSTFQPVQGDRMKSRQIDKAHWQSFFDTMSKLIQAKRAEIEIAGLGLGDQIEAEWLPVIGLVYDPKDDIVEIALENVDHLVHGPREVHALDTPTGFSSILIVDRDGNRHMLHLRDPQMLPDLTREQDTEGRADKTSPGTRS
jgi:hypothetical protein